MSIQSTLNKAMKLARAGDRVAAARLYRQVLATAPGHPGARAALAALSEGGAPAMRPGAGPAPTPAQLDQIKALIDRGALPQALAEAERLAGLFPSAAALINLLATAQSRTGRTEAALTSFTRLTRLDPGFLPGWLGRANAAGKLGRLDEVEAACAQALALDPRATPAHMIRGTALVRAGRGAEAEAAFRAALALSPGLPHAHLGLGNARAAQGDPSGALAAYRAAARARPGAPEASQSIAGALLALGRPEAALAELAAARARTPAHPGLQLAQARALRAAGQAEAAIAAATEATRLAPHNPEAWGLAATCKRELGDRDGARADIDRALDLAPSHPLALSLRWQDEPLPADHPDHARVAALLNDPRLAEADRALLEFLLFRAEDAAGKPEAAFAHLGRANALRRAAAPYDIAAQRAQFAALKAAFPAATAGLDVAPEAPRPLFIVGMPRSGTSLVEQILASHSQVQGGGELEALGQIMAALGWSQGAVGAPPGPDSLAALRRDYRAALRRLGSDRPVVTDKMPLNFRWLGFALAALPEARVLYLRRDARATCWSAYAADFTGGANGFCHDLGDTAQMFRLHLDLMDHWRALYPDRIAEVPYEALTTDQEGESRKLLAAAGLDWEPACLEFHQTRRAVRTASGVQVRLAMYQGSSQAWRRYEPQLGPMLEALAGIV